jgi:hypothetical protein
MYDKNVPSQTTTRKHRTEHILHTEACNSLLHSRFTLHISSVRRIFTPVFSVSVRSGQRAWLPCSIPQLFFLCLSSRNRNNCPTHAACRCAAGDGYCIGREDEWMTPHLGGQPPAKRLNSLQNACETLVCFLQLAGFDRATRREFDYVFTGGWLYRLKFKQFL